MEQDLQDHTRDLIRDLDGIAEDEKPDTDNGLKIINKVADLKKRSKQCMSPNKVASISAHLQPLVDEAWQAQRTETEPSMFNIRAAAALLTLAETDIRQAEKATKKKHNSSNNVNRSPAHTETDHTTHSENLPTAPSTEEQTIWQEFQSEYAKLPHPDLKL